MQRRGRCPGCDQYIRKRRYDRFLKCYTCGWIEGWPLFRWLTHYPRRLWRQTRYQRRRIFRKGVGSLKIAGLLLLILWVATAAFGDIGGVSDLAPASGEEAGVESEDNIANINETYLERLVHEEINERRLERGLAPLDYDEELAQIANSHSEHMARDDFYNHTAPNGSGVNDRYQRFGYNCRIELDDGRYITGGAENILYTYYKEDVKTKQGLRHYDSHSELADGMVDGWMNSTGHRKNILQPVWKNEGVGVAVTREGGMVKVYATQNFC